MTTLETSLPSRFQKDTAWEQEHGMHESTLCAKEKDEVRRGTVVYVCTVHFLCEWCHTLFTRHV